MSKTLKKSEYQQLVRDIVAVYEQAKVDAAQAVEQVIVQAYWEIGRMIVEVEQKGELRAEYGQQLVENLSAELSEKFAKGFSYSNLYYMRQVYLKNRILHTSGELRWSHYKLLSSIEKDEQRKYYKNRIIEEGWSFRKLQNEIKKNRVARQRIFKRNRIEEESKPKKLPVKRGQLYTYQIIAPKIMPPKKGTAVVDRGFGLWKQVKISRTANPQPGDIVEAYYAGDQLKFKYSSSSKSVVFTFKATLDRVIDGDTLWALLDLGFGDFTRRDLRLKGINASELDTNRGEEAKAFVENALTSVDFFIAKTYYDDKYGRPLTDIFYLPDEPDPNVVAAEGIFLNQELVDKNLARVV